MHQYDQEMANIERHYLKKKKQEMWWQWKYERKIGFITSGSGCQLNHKAGSFGKANQNTK